MKKRLFGTALTISLLFTALPSISHAQEDNLIMVNGEQVLVNPIMDNDRLLVPIQGTFEKLGAEVKWDKEKAEVFIEDNYTLVELFIDKNIALVHKKFDFTGIPLKAEIDVAPRVVDNTVYVPLRFVAESINASVDWDNDRNEASISSRKINKPVTYDVVTLDEIQKSPILLKWYEDNKPNKGVFSTKEDGFTYVMISGGMMKTGGYSMTINGIVQDTTEDLYVYASLETPSEGSFNTQVISYPSIIIKIKNTDIQCVNGTIY